MQIVIGNLTSDAKVRELKDGRKVVNFTIAENDRYKPKDSEEYKEVTTYYNCSYWMGTGIAPLLTKGRLVQATGRLSVNAWMNAEGKAKAGINLHTQFLKPLGKGKSNNADILVTTSATSVIEADADDLPF